MRKYYNSIKKFYFFNKIIKFWFSKAFEKFSIKLRFLLSISSLTKTIEINSSKDDDNFGGQITLTDEVHNSIFDLV